MFADPVLDVQSAHDGYKELSLHSIARRPELGTYCKQLNLGFWFTEGDQRPGDHDDESVLYQCPVFEPASCVTKIGR
jgi:hypothetical protein